MPTMDTVFLGGTTAGTTWRRELIDMLKQHGIDESVVYNPHKAKGSGYTLADAAREIACKHKPSTIVVLRLCPSVPDPEKYKGKTEEELVRASLSLGPLTCFEIGLYMLLASDRTAFVVDVEQFGMSRSAKVIEIFKMEIAATAKDFDFDFKPNIFTSLEETADWVALQLNA